MRHTTEVIGSAMVIGGAALALASETTQSYPKIYDEAVNRVGVGLGNVLIGQLGDIAVPTFAVMGTMVVGISLMLTALERSTSKEDRDTIAFIGGLLCSNFIGIMYLGVEIINMVRPDIFAADCGTGSGSWCPGDYADILSFSIPMISTSIFLLRYRHSHRRQLAPSH